MFNKVHKIGVEPGATADLVFVGSKYVKAFPCGRRRAQKAANSDAYIPFDQEAKLNTEFNNRKHIGTNGLASSFYNGKNWSADILKIVIGGYTFNIDLNDSYNEENTFCRGILKAIGDNNSIDTSTTNLVDNIAGTSNRAIYANIKLASVHLFESSDDALDSYTWILKNQSNDDNISYLDIATTTSPSTSNDYYFSGLSFSVVPIATTLESTDRFFNETSSQQDYSLKLFVYDENTEQWKINPTIFLPEIEHGETDKSVKVEELFVNSIKLGTGNFSAPSLEIIRDKIAKTSQFKFRCATITEEVLESTIKIESWAFTGDASEQPSSGSVYNISSKYYNNGKLYILWADDSNTISIPMGKDEADKYVDSAVAFSLNTENKELTVYYKLN